MPHRVYIVGGDYRIGSMFLKEPMFQLVDKLRKANIVIFPGGPDVNPVLYGEKSVHPKTFYDHERDKQFVTAWNITKEPAEFFKIGICGGGQFLNVANGGRMWQDVNNHAISGVHPMTYVSYNGANDPLASGTSWDVTSTHHQMMRPGEGGDVWGYATLSTHRDTGDVFNRPSNFPAEGPDTEIVFYKRTMSLCFQPHPEYGHEETRTLFMKCVMRVIAQNRISAIPRIRSTTYIPKINPSHSVH